MLNLFKIYILKEFWEIKNNKMKLALGFFFNIIIIYILYNNYKIRQVILKEKILVFWSKMTPRI